MLAWLKRIWPFTWKSTVAYWLSELDYVVASENQLQRDVNDANKKIAALTEQNTKLAADVVKAENTAVTFQSRFDGLMERYEGTEKWSMIKSGLIHMIEDRRPHMYYVCTPPYIKDFSPVYANNIEAKYIEPYTLSCSISVGMNEQAYPELVAKYVGKQIELAILKHWQNQSILEAKV